MGDEEIWRGGDGTEADPYEIASAIHLWLVRTELDKHFELTNDLDLSVITEEEGFDPIGDRMNSLTGTFDGKGKLIRNLRINRPAEDYEEDYEEDYIGLFGRVGVGGVVKNIGLEDKAIIGALVGYSHRGRIEKSYATGRVTGKKMVGGLVGWDVFTVRINGKNYWKEGSALKGGGLDSEPKVFRKKTSS